MKRLSIFISELIETNKIFFLVQIENQELNEIKVVFNSLLRKTFKGS